MSRVALFVAWACGLVLVPVSAWAQDAVPPAARVAAGARHVLTEPDHLLAILALALLAGQVGRRALLWTPVCLAAGLVVGALSGSALPLLAQVETVNLTSVAILGALVALHAPLPIALPGVLGLVFGWSHGYANVLDLGGTTPPLAFVLGLVAGGLGVVVAVSLSTSALRAGWQQIAVRTVGSWICAIGAMVLALQLSGE